MDLGEAMHAFIAEAFPICRSITGDGVRETLRVLPSSYRARGKRVPPAPVFLLDHSLRMEHPRRLHRAPGRRPCRDFADNNLHIVQYSRPFDEVVPLPDLRPHLHTLPDQPDWIPYRTSYYADNWGFCLRHRDLLLLTDERYRVVIDADLAPGHLTYGELFIPGSSEETVLFSCHVCHPSLANDNLAGIAVATMLARHIGTLAPRYSYRFLFIPGTIGSLTWLSRNEDLAPRVAHGLVLSCLGDPGPMTYKQSRRGNAPIDRIVAYVLGQSAPNYSVRPFEPYGYDERQYCSPGFESSGWLSYANAERRVSGVSQFRRQSFSPEHRKPRPFTVGPAADRRRARRK